MTEDETETLLTSVADQYPTLGEILESHDLHKGALLSWVTAIATTPLEGPESKFRALRAGACVALGYQLAKELDRASEHKG